MPAVSSDAYASSARSLWPGRSLLARASVGSRPYVSPARIREFPTGVDTESPVMTGFIHEMKLLQQRRIRELWQRVIDKTLTMWLRDPSELEDDGIDAPSGAIVRLSLDLADSCMESDLAAPDRIVPDPNGGIVFERREGNVSEVLHVWDDGSVEYMKFDGAQMIDRGPFPVGN